MGVLLLDIAARPGIELTTAWSKVRRPNRYAVITIAIRLRYDCDVLRAPASNSTQAKNEHVDFWT